MDFVIRKMIIIVHGIYQLSNIYMCVCTSCYRHDNAVFRRRSFKSNEEQHERYEHRRKRRYSDPASVDLNEVTDEEKKETIENLEANVTNKNSGDSSHTTQNEYNEVASNPVIESTKKHVPSYTGPATEYSKRMFAKLYGISVDEIIYDVNEPNNCTKEQEYKEILYNGSKQLTETKNNSTSMSKSVTPPSPKTPPTKKLRPSKLRGKQHPTDLIKLGAQNIFNSSVEKKNIQETTSSVEKKNMQETTSSEVSNKQRIEALNNKPKDEMIQNSISKVDSPTATNIGNLKLDTSQACESHESPEFSKQGQSRIKQLLHDSHKFLIKAKTIRPNKLMRTPTPGHSKSISTVPQGDMSSPDTEKMKLVNNKTPSVSTKPNVVNSNKKSRQAQFVASLFNSLESNNLNGSGDPNAATLKPTTLKTNISLNMKSNMAGKILLKEKLDDKLAETTSKKKTNLSEDKETNIPGDIISPILAKISENVCKLPLLKNKLVNQGVPAAVTKCPKTAPEKIIQNVHENSCSILGEDTLGMVTLLARSRQTVSPIKTPDKEGKVDGSLRRVGKKYLQEEKVASLNFSAINKPSLLQKETGIKSSYLPTSSTLVNKNQCNAVLNKHGVSVCFSSEHGEFKRKRSKITPVTIETDDSSPEKRRKLDHIILEKHDGHVSNVKKIISTEMNEKNIYGFNNKVAVKSVDRSKKSNKIIDLETVGSKNSSKIEKIENNSGKENNEEIETLRKHNTRSPRHKGRGSNSQRRSPRIFRYSSYRHMRRSLFRSFERYMRRRSPGYLTYSDRSHRSRRSRSVTPVRFRSRRSRSYSPIKLRSKRSVSLSPPRQLKKEKYLKQSKTCKSNSQKPEEKLGNKLSNDISDDRVNINYIKKTPLNKSESSVKNDTVGKSKGIDKSSIQQNTNTKNICTSVVVNNKSPLSKEIKTNMVSVSSLCNDSPLQKLSNEINRSTNKTEKEYTNLKNNVVTTPILKITDTPPPVIIMKRKSRKVVKLEDNETVSAVSIKSPQKSSEIKLQAYSETKEHTVVNSSNTFCVTQEQKETMALTAENVIFDHNLHDRQKETTSTVTSENLNIILDNKTLKSNVPEVSSVNKKTSDVKHKVKGNDFVLTKDNIKKLNSCHNRSDKNSPQTLTKKQLYMTLFGPSNSKCSSDSSETEEGELSSSEENGKE